MKLRLTYRFKYLQDALLYESVPYAWDSQRSFLIATRLINEHSPDRLRSVVAQHISDTLNDLLVTHLLNVVDGHSIRPGGIASVVRFQVTVRQSDICFRTDNLQQLIKVVVVFAGCIQRIKHFLHVVILVVTQLRFLQHGL